MALVCDDTDDTLELHYQPECVFPNLCSKKSRQEMVCIAYLCPEFFSTDPGVEGIKSDGRRSHRSCTPRKEARKQQRLDRKKRNADFHGVKKRPAVDEHPESPQRKRARQEGPSGNSQLQDGTLVASTIPKTKKEKGKKSTTNNDSHKSTRLSSAPKPRSQIEEEEDSYIAYLEAKLGYSSRGKKERKSEDDDGLSGEYVDTVFVE